MTAEQHKVALVFYSTLEGAGHSAVYRQLMFAQELMRHGDDVTLVFDGAGTQTLAALIRPDHEFHRIFQTVRPRLRGACHFCAKSYGVMDELREAGIPLLGDDRGHASLRALLNEQRQIVTV